MSGNDKISKFYIIFTFIFLTLTYSILSFVFIFPSVFATSSNSDNESEQSRDDSNQSDGNEINDTTISSSEDDEQQQDSLTNEDSNENSINDNNQLPTEPQDAPTASSQELTPQNNNQIPPNTLNGNIGMQEQPRENTDLTSDFSNTVVPIKPDPNLENSPGNLNVVLKIECKSVNGQPSDRAVCDTYTKDPDFIKPKDYSLTLDITRDGTNSKSTFPGDSEGQIFTITPGEFDVYGELNGDAYTVVGKKGGFSQFNYIDYKPSTQGDCENVIQPIAGPVGRLHAEGIIYPLTNITCIITMELEYRYFVLPKSSFGDMLQNQRMPDAVIQK
ncbi:hypothetical protein [Candidatus Nitrosocosmicus hydrocola]|uniref:hypothetical protein n=1 Tax=Candidatus Nitrosocosmicus hydrocola TaxID=1826872 RepID=UPI000ABB8211|nr:hypothetical protein [Candidatus Nitrosocosmicus hydrocola]